MTTLSSTKFDPETCKKNKSIEKTPDVVKEEKSEMELLLERLPVLNEFFLLHSKIGKGTFSTVYLATLRNGNSTQKYAVKHLTQTCEQSRIQNELKCLQEIGGKDNVVPAELCLTNGSDCVTFIMPYLPHIRFSDYVVDMDAEETRCYMQNLFIALRRVHSFNIIHRDVKPDNFLYNRETKQFFLVDFGLAQFVRSLNKETNKIKSLVDENLPIDYSQKNKRKLDSSDDEEKTKSNKRIALKSKDINVKIFVTPKTYTETKTDIDKTVIQEKNDLKSPLKQWTNKPDMDKTPVKSRFFNPINVPSSSRRKLIDIQETSTPKSSYKFNDNSDYSEEKISNESCNLLHREISFTPLVSTKSKNGNFVQIKNSRVVSQQTISSTSKSDIFKKQTPSSSTSFSQSCPCSGKAAICSICKSRKPMFAPRAGTSGFRPPEVLFKHLHQTTAVDMWASGVVMLCILSGCYPFFNSSTDLVSLAEIMTIFGTERTIKVASKFGRRIICSENSKGVDLKKLCIRLRARSAKKSKTRKCESNEPKCKDCFQEIKNDGCLCPSVETSNEVNTTKSEVSSQFPDSAYDLLYRLLDLDPSTRITAAEALEHPFITGL